LNDYNNTIEYAKKESWDKGALKVLKLVEQGYKPAEIKKMVLTNK